MAEAKIRIEEETKKELHILAIGHGKQSMSKMVQYLIEYYKNTKGVNVNENKIL